MIRTTRRGGRRLSTVVLAAAVLWGLVAASASSGAVERAASLPPGFSDTTVWNGFNFPTAIALSPDGHVFVAEKRGLIKEFSSLSDPTASLFADLTRNVSSFADRGLLGLAVDPQFGTTGHDYVYVLYTLDAPPGANPPVWNDTCPKPPGGLDDGCVVTGNLVRIAVNADGTQGKTKVLIKAQWCQQFPSHSIGHLAFGPDGKLYVTGGDGASFVHADYGQYGGSLQNTPTPANPCGDPPGGVGVALTSPTARGGAVRAQSLRRPAGEPALLNGTLLRINPKNGNGVRGNPGFDPLDRSSNASRIVAYGFRNPFRFTFRPGTREIWVGDVGWDTWEEIDRVPKPTVKPAPNYGWPCYEGTPQNGDALYVGLDMCQSLYSAGTAIAPYDAYDHQATLGPGDTCTSAGGAAVISAIAFTAANSNYPSAYTGALFFGDRSRNCMWVMQAGANGLPSRATLQTFIDDGDNPYPVDIEPDPVSGDLFYVDLDLGQIHRISYTP